MKEMTQTPDLSLVKTFAISTTYKEYGVVVAITDSVITLRRDYHGNTSAEVDGQPVELRSAYHAIEYADTLKLVYEERSQPADPSVITSVEAWELRRAMRLTGFYYDDMTAHIARVTGRPFAGFDLKHDEAAQVWQSLKSA